jgi:hypothetical protein
LGKTTFADGFVHPIADSILLTYWGVIDYGRCGRAANITLHALIYVRTTAAKYGNARSN